jgi:magnesium-transporting ATPase (P-type)
VTPPGFKAISLEPFHLPDGAVSSSYKLLDGTIICDLPNNDLHQFNGSLKMR